MGTKKELTSGKCTVCHIATVTAGLILTHIGMYINKVLYRCPQKSGTLDFCYFDIQKYSVFFSSDKTLSSE